MITRLGERRTLLLGLLALTLAILPTPLVRTLGGLVALQALGGFGRGLLYPLLMSLSIKAVAAPDRASAMGIFQASYAFGMFIGPWISGGLADRLGLASVFVVGGMSVSRMLAGLYRPDHSWTPARRPPVTSVRNPPGHPLLPSLGCLDRRCLPQRLVRHSDRQRHRHRGRWRRPDCRALPGVSAAAVGNDVDEARMNIQTLFALLVGLTVGIVFMNIPPVLTELMDVYGTSYTQISVLMSALLWTHAAMQIPAGMIADRLGIRRTQVLSLACIGVGSLLPAIAPDLGWAVVGRVITGLGTGMGFLVSLKMVSLYAPGGRAGAYQAFFGGFFSLGSVLAYGLTPYIVTAGWQWAFLAPGLLCLPLLALVPVLRFVPQASAHPSVSIRRMAGMRSGFVLGVYHALSYGSLISLGNWVPSLLAEVSGTRTATTLVWGGALVMLVSGLSRLCGGFVMFRVPPLPVAHGSVLILCVLFAGLACVPTPGLVLGLALLAAWFGSFNFGALFHLASRAASVESVGTLLGLVNLLGNLGAIAFTLMFGWFKDTLGTLAWGFAVMSVLGVTGLVAGIRLLSSPLANPPAGQHESRKQERR